VIARLRAPGQEKTVKYRYLLQNQAGFLQRGYGPQSSLRYAAIVWRIFFHCLSVSLFSSSFVFVSIYLFNLFFYLFVYLFIYFLFIYLFILFMYLFISFAPIIRVNHHSLFSFLAYSRSTTMSRRKRLSCWPVTETMVKSRSESCKCIPLAIACNSNGIRDGVLVTSFC
jgi:hypothetical protein